MTRTPRTARPRIATLIVAGAVSLALMSLTVPGPAVAAPPKAPTASPGTAHTVTLITGDVVTITDLGDDRGHVEVDQVDPGSGVRTQTIGDEVYVYPDEVLPYLAASVLDDDLFNVTALIRDGFADEDMGEIPLIVEYAPTVRSLRSAPKMRNSEVQATLESINANAITTEKTGVRGLWEQLTSGASTRDLTPKFAAQVDHISLDGLVEASLDHSVPQVGAPEAWDLGFDGSGVTVAVLDTGIDADHADIGSALIEQRSFVPGEDAGDRNGHGTHVASTVLGSGAASEGVNSGVAPGAELAVGKVLSDEGEGLESWIIEGMEWGAERADVINLSLGSSEPSDGTDPMAAAVNSLTAQTGALFVVAAGNQGGEGTIGSPAAADSALTVGAVDDEDVLAYFSSRGPRFGDGALKPDLVAPGVDINAARAALSPGTGSYVEFSGTSMATPHVAGGAAILKQRYPDLDGPALKNILMSSTDPIADILPYDGGTGRLNLAAAVTDSISATGALDFGLIKWPYADAEPISRTLTYTNSSDQPVELALSATAAGPDGTTPEGLLTLSTDSVTVPASGTVDVTVTADPGLIASETRHQGAVIASIGDQAITRSSVAAAKEGERYDLDLAAKDRSGNPAHTYVVMFDKTYGNAWPVAVDGETTLRLPAGEYSAMSYMSVADAPDQQGVALIGNPGLVLDKSQTVVFDARQANLASATVSAAVEPTQRRMDYFVKADQNFAETYRMPAVVDRMYAAPTVPVPEDEFGFNSRWRLRTPRLQVKADDQLLDTIEQHGSSTLEGKIRGTALSVGTGQSSDYQGIDARNKIAVAVRSDSISEWEQAQAARSAGAKALVVINDAPTELSGNASGPEGEEAGLTVVAISGIDGAELLDRMEDARVLLEWIGKPETSVVYDLVDPHLGRIPSDLSYQPQPRDLTRIDATYHGVTEAAGGEYRYDFQPWTRFGVGFLEKTRFPARRAEWVSSQPTTSWYQGVRRLDVDWEERGVRQGYRPGSRLTEDWFAPIVRPFIGDGFWAPNRQTKYLMINIPSWAGSGAGHTGSVDGGPATQHLELYQEGKLIESVDYQALSSDEMPAEKTWFKIINTTTHDASVLPTSTETRTEWEFHNAESDEWETVLPLLQVGFQLPVDLDGRVAAGTKVPIGLTVAAPADAVGAGRVTSATLEVSADNGRSWKTVPLAGKNGAYTGTIKNPSRPGAGVSVRVTARDDAGNSIRQSITKAYLLK